jgi:hypothetical protein
LKVNLDPNQELGRQDRVSQHLGGRIDAIVDNTQKDLFQRGAMRIKANNA